MDDVKNLGRVTKPVVGDQFRVVSADDSAKFDHELHCTKCGERLCDVEAGDSLNSLIMMALEHVCKPCPVCEDCGERHRGGCE